MAYMNQETKKKIVELAKPVLKKYGIKATFAVNNHSTLVCNIKSGKIDFIQNYNETIETDHVRCAAGFHQATNYLSINRYWYQNHFTGAAKAFLDELLPILNIENYDNSQIEYDYHDVGYYLDINVGKWNKPYKLEA